MKGNKKDKEGKTFFETLKGFLPSRSISALREKRADFNKRSDQISEHAKSVMQEGRKDLDRAKATIEKSKSVTTKGSSAAK